MTGCSALSSNQLVRGMEWLLTEDEISTSINPNLQLLHDLLQSRQPGLEFRTRSFGRHRFAGCSRQELAVGALEDRRRLLQLSLEALSRRHEVGDDAGERLSSDVVRACEERGPPGA